MKVEISVLADGRGVLFLDGLDMSRYVSGFRVECDAGEGAEVHLRLRKGVRLDLEALDPVITFENEEQSA